MNTNDDSEQMAALFGPFYPYSDHKIGETIRFKLRGQEVEGLITWVTAPTDLPSGRHAPVTYICSVPDELLPTLVYQSELIES